MQKDEIAKLIFGASHLTGEFKLRSGQLSNEYFDKYRFESKPNLLTEIAKAMKPLVPADTEVLAGLEMGGIPVATAVSMQTGLEAAFVRKKAKEYGTMKICEGVDVNNKKVCIVEDIVTTGGQIIESVKELRKLGANIEVVLCVILRDPKAIELLANEGLELRAAFTMEYIKEAVSS